MAEDRTAPKGTSTSMTPAPTERAIARSALERVLARATELQGSGAEPVDAVSEDRLVEIAREVGIDPHHVRQALAEERARVPLAEHEGGLLLDAMGQSTVEGQRTVPGSASEVQARLESWMPRMESMALRRKLPQRVSWEPRRTVLNNALRVLGTAHRAELVHADQVVATVTPVDDTRSVVRFDVELDSLRRSNRNLALGLGVFANAAAWLAVAVPVVTLIPNTEAATIGVAALGAVQAGAGWSLWRALKNRYRRTLGRVQLRVEQMLDELEQGGMQSPPTLLQQVRGALLGEQGKS